MRFPKPKDRSEREALAAAFDQIRAEWGFAKSFGLPELLRRWTRFVQEAESGYELTIDDFTHDLSMRDILEEVKDSVPFRLRQEIGNLLRPWDERYILATEPISRPIEGIADEETREWWFRIPKLAGIDVERYLFEKGFRRPE